MADRLVLTFTVDRETLHQGILASGKLVSRTMPRRIKLRATLAMFVVVVGMVAILSILQSFGRANPLGWVGLLIFMFGAASGFVYFNVFSTGVQRHVASLIVKAGGDGGRTQTVIDAQGVHETTGAFEIHFKWSAFSGCARFKHGLVLVFGALTVVLPAAAMVDGVTVDDVEAFVTKLAERPDTAPRS